MRLVVVVEQRRLVLGTNEISVQGAKRVTDELLEDLCHVAVALVYPNNDDQQCWPGIS